MIEKVLVVRTRLGLHAKPSAMFVSEANKHKCRVLVVKDGLEVNGKSIMGLMLLAAESGSKLTVRFDGPDEAQAAAAIEKLFERRFDEE
jgi:phosphocarrier protein HPr